MQLTEGTRIGAFEITAWLGSGGMGEVYRARDRRLDRDVAIKVLRAPAAVDSDRLARFEREARALASLNHPRIGAIYGLEESAGLLALVLEIVEGQTLAERIARGPIAVKDALGIARQIVDALDAAHAHDIVHRDLKPANVKVRSDGAVKVLDFGLAKSLAAAGVAISPDGTPTITVDGTRMGVAVGTPAYMSPEQARGEPVDERADVWGFGCVLFEMLTGTRAFAGGTVADTVAAVVEREPDWDALPATTPSLVRRLLTRCLTKDPNRRLRSIADAGLDLDEALATPGGASGKVALPISHAGPPSLGRRRRPHLVWAAVSGVLLALLIAATRSDSPPGPSRIVTLTVMPPSGTTFPRGSGAPWPSISRDGRRLAFVANRSRQQQRLWVRPLDSPIARELAGTDGAMRPFWSPDGRSIGYFANGTLAVVDVDTGAVRVLTHAPYEGGLAGAWGDGVIVFTGGGGLLRIAATGGPPGLVMRTTDRASLVVPDFLPDGRRFLYTEEALRGDDSRLCVASLDSSQTQCIPAVPAAARYAPPGYLLTTEGGTVVALPFDADRVQLAGEQLIVIPDRVDADPPYAPPPFSASADGVLAYAASAESPRLTWVDRTGAPQGSPLGPGWRPALTHDQKRMLVQRQEPTTGNIDLWSIDLEHGTESRLTSGRARDAWPAISRDGSRIAYSSSTDGLHVRRANGDDDQALGVAGVNPDFSPDGSRILFQQYSQSTGFDLWIVPLDGDRKPVPFAQTGHGEREGRFSPDGRWVAYDSTESGRREIWIQPFPTGTRRQVSTQGGVSPQWRQDGRELFYVAADGALMAVPIDVDATLQWGAARRLFQTMFAGGVYAPYAVSNDGQRFLMPAAAAPGEDTPITVVVNWTAAFRQ